MNKQDIAEKIATQFSMPKSQALSIVEATFDIITEGMNAADKVQVFGFGTFEKVEKKARKGRNPKTGETITIAAKSSPKFKPAKQLKDAMK